ncbi:MAG: hypothetical protein PVF96_08550 [Candidatus Bathyarchaeota archaeon]|jgi:hypothetical protein
MFLVVVGLIFEASGFGILVVGRLDGVILIIMGITMFWGGWEMSGAHSFSCAAAAILNMFDAASTISFWNFEINPLVLSTGPTIFLLAKVICSISIVLYAKIHPTPHRCGAILTTFFGLIVGWNLGQHIMAYLGLRIISYEFYIFVIVTTFTLVISITTLLLRYLLRPITS